MARSLDRREKRGFSLPEIMAAITIGAMIFSGLSIAASSWQKLANTQQTVTELGKIDQALGEFLKRYGYLPNLTNAFDLILWGSLYKPPNDMGGPSAPLPTDLTYEIRRPYLRYGLTTNTIPGEVRIWGVRCDKFRGNSQDFCDLQVDKY